MQGTILKLRICCVIVAEKKTAAAAIFPIFSFIALLSIKSFPQLLYFTQIEGKTFWLSMMTQWRICRRKWMNGMRGNELCVWQFFLYLCSTSSCNRFSHQNWCHCNKNTVRSIHFDQNSVKKIILDSLYFFCRVLVAFYFGPA